MIEAAEKVIGHAREIAHVHHADQHDVHTYYFDVDPKCPHRLCRGARERMADMEAAMAKMRAIRDGMEQA